ncbi:MAG: polyprenyl synthetase family protein [Actinomycetota bacterium]
MVAFTPSFDDLRARTDLVLRGFLADRHTALPEATLLIEEIARLIDAGGKRIRPSFCYWGYRAAGGRDGEAPARAAASLELLHTFAIVHDDIMDASDQRRGVPTVHAVHCEDVALLAGDLALVLADELFFSSGFDAPVLLRGFAPYSSMRQEVIAGQYLDHEASVAGVVTEQHARRVAVLKSGRYTIEQPLAIGGALAGAAGSFIAELRAFGAPLGEAFQLRDDLLGTFGEASELGKPVDSDIREGKRNVLFAKAAGALSEDERDFFLTHWGGGEALSEADVSRLRALVETSGARRATEDLLARLARAAMDSLAQVETDGESRTALGELARAATFRKA